MNNFCLELTKKKNYEKEKQKMNDLMLKYIFKSEKIIDLTDQQIEKSFLIIDWIYFNNALMNKIKKMKYQISFFASNKLTKTAGKLEYFIYKQHDIEIWRKYILTISKKIIENLFCNNEKNLMNGGLLCYNSVHCFIITLQHEIVHLIIYLFCIKFNKPSHSTLFKWIVYNLFEHTEVEHRLLWGDYNNNQAKLENFRASLKLGDTIKTNEYKNKFIIGKIHKINYKNNTVWIITDDNLKYIVYIEFIDRIL